MGIGSRCCCLIGEPLDHACGIFDLYTSIREQTDVLCHVPEVVNGLVCVGVQISKRIIDGAKSSSIPLCVGKNSLNRAKLCLVFAEPI